MEYIILTIGQFSRNRFWGEKDTESYRDALCTSTLIRSGNDNIIVDPSKSGKNMEEVLYNRSGLHPKDVRTVFFTHHHGDHLAGAHVFNHAKWYMSEIELQMMRTGNPEEKEMAERIFPVFSGFVPGIECIPLPGHTLGNTGLLFESCDGRVLICGDAVMTRDFFRERIGYYNSVDFEMSANTIDKIENIADIVVPGHDNYFIV